MLDQEAAIYLDDYFDAEDINDLLAGYGWEMIKRTFGALETVITIRTVDADHLYIDDVVSELREWLNVDANIIWHEYLD